MGTHHCGTIVQPRQQTHVCGVIFTVDYRGWSTIVPFGFAHGCVIIVFCRPSFSLIMEVGLHKEWEPKICRDAILAEPRYSRLYSKRAGRFLTYCNHGTLCVRVTFTALRSMILRSWHTGFCGEYGAVADWIDSSVTLPSIP